MIAQIASLLFAVFPVRGTMWRSLDSVVVLDQDTLHLRGSCLGGYCYTCEYEVLAAKDTSKMLAFESGEKTYPNVLRLTWNDKPIIDDPPGSTKCVAGVSLFPERQRRFILHGRRDWGVWADSLRDSIHNGVVVKPVLVRWRWAPLEPSIPWVRWIDTLHIGPQPFPSTKAYSFSDQPVLTTTKPVVLDSIVPSVVDCARGLRLHSELAGEDVFDWGYSLTICRDEPQGNSIPHPTATIPAGTVSAGRTFLVRDAFNSFSSALWRMRVGGREVDSLRMFGAATTDVRKPHPEHPSFRTGTVAFEPATGRRLRLSSPLPLGKRLLVEPSGTRLIVVE